MHTIKNNLKFGLNFLRNPLQNASLIPSSASSTEAMLSGIDFSSITSVVELGPGTGVFTKEILKRSKPETKILLLEVEEAYVRMLQEEFGRRVIIECASAHLFDVMRRKHGMEKVDLIISGLPFSLPQPVKEGLHASLKAHTEQGTIYRFFTYNPPMMKRTYKSLPIRKVSFVLTNFPPLWVYGIN